MQGKYISKTSARYFHPFSSFAAHNTLILKKDSTFYYQTCGSVATGYWRIKQDSLILTYLTHKATRDSSELNKLKCHFSIKANGDLHRSIYTENNKLIYDYLVKVREK